MDDDTLDQISDQLERYETVCEWGHVHNKHLGYCPLCSEGYDD